MCFSSSSSGCKRRYGPSGGAIFSNRAHLLLGQVAGTAVETHHAARQHDTSGRGWEGVTVCRRCCTEHSLETRGERTDARQADFNTDTCHAVVGVPQQSGGPLKPPGQQVHMRRLSEPGPKCAAEVRAAQPSGVRHRCHVDRLIVVAVGEIFGAKQMPIDRGAVSDDCAPR